MARGGKRPGAGRKTGSATEKTRLIANQAAKDGITPLEVMIENMRWHRDRALEAEALNTTVLDAAAQTLLRDSIVAFRRSAQACASDAASYMHPSLKSIEHKGEDGGPLRIEIVRFTDPPAK